MQFAENLLRIKPNYVILKSRFTIFQNLKLQDEFGFQM